MQTATLIDVNEAGSDIDFLDTSTDKLYLKSVQLPTPRRMNVPFVVDEEAAYEKRTVAVEFVFVTSATVDEVNAGIRNIDRLLRRAKRQHDGGRPYSIEFRLQRTDSSYTNYFVVIGGTVEGPPDPAHAELGQGRPNSKMTLRCLPAIRSHSLSSNGASLSMTNTHGTAQSALQVDNCDDGSRDNHITLVSPTLGDLPSLLHIDAEVYDFGGGASTQYTLWMGRGKPYDFSGTALAGTCGGEYERINTPAGGTASTYTPQTVSNEGKPLRILARCRDNGTDGEMIVQYAVGDAISSSGDAVHETDVVSIDTDWSIVDLGVIPAPVSGKQGTGNLTFALSPGRDLGGSGGYIDLDWVMVFDMSGPVLYFDNDTTGVEEGDAFVSETTSRFPRAYIRYDESGSDAYGFPDGTVRGAPLTYSYDDSIETDFDKIHFVQASGTADIDWTLRVTGHIIARYMSER